MARLTAIVVLPEPPFGEYTETTVGPEAEVGLTRRLISCSRTRRCDETRLSAWCSSEFFGATSSRSAPSRASSRQSREARTTTGEGSSWSAEEAPTTSRSPTTSSGPPLELSSQKPSSIT